MRHVSTPERAADLLTRYGAPEHEAQDVLGRDPPTVPEAAEGQGFVIEGNETGGVQTNRFLALGEGDAYGR